MTRVVTTIVCTSCEGEGYYVLTPWGWDCTECGHVIATSDVDLEDGEILTTDAAGCLAYATNA